MDPTLVPVTYISAKSAIPFRSLSGGGDIEVLSRYSSIAGALSESSDPA
jgi:hypothetical protein